MGEHQNNNIGKGFEQVPDIQNSQSLFQCDNGRYSFDILESNYCYSLPWFYDFKSDQSEWEDKVEKLQNLKLESMKSLSEICNYDEEDKEQCAKEPSQTSSRSRNNDFVQKLIGPANHSIRK